MGKILLLVCGISFALITGYIFFGGKNKNKKVKKEDKATDKEKMIEPAIKTDRNNKPEEKAEEKKEEQKVEKPETDSSGFRIIRKKSEVKINKAAIKNGSRNPSVTRVFDKNGKKIDESIDDKLNIEKIDDSSSLEMKKQDVIVGRFGAREVDYNVVNKGNEFFLKNEEGALNRAPIITDRTNFGSHLNISEDNNLSGVVGTGIKSADEGLKQIVQGIDDDTENMVKNVKRNFLDIEGDLNPFDYFQRERTQAEKPKKSKLRFKDLDAKTLIIADAISNPKYKNINKK